MTLNPSQRAAVERWGQDVCVVAGPGSGKTRVLIERFRWLVEHKGIPPGRILAVTFTEKAATEIRKRLIEAFAASDPFRIQIERAWVSTLHGFCTRLLKEHAVAAGIDPDFRLLDQAQSRIEQQRIAGHILDSLLVKRPDLVRTLLAEWNNAGSGLDGALLALYEEIRTAGVKVEELRSPEPPDDRPFRALIENARLLLDDPVTGSPGQREAHRRLHEWARSVLSTPAEPDWRALLAVLDGCPKAASLKTGARARSVVRQLEEQGIAQAKAALILRARLPLYPLLLDAIVGIHQGYARWKRERGLMDFSGLEEHAIGLLESDSGLRARIRERFDQVLMDELQDTNRLQWKLIDLIRRPDRLFAVGDINQSIYFFRHADPGVFHSYRNGLLDRSGKVDEVRENYRSRPEILEAVNAIVPHLPGVEWHSLTACREFPPKDGPAVEFLHTFGEREDQDDVELEARWIAYRIGEMQGSMRIGKPGAQRPARYSDIAVLSRTIQGLSAVQQALDEAGIPSQTSGGRSFHEAREVKDLIAWLSVLANPLSEPGLTLALRSPLVGISDETLLRLKMDREPLWEAIERITGAGGFRHRDMERLLWFRELIGAQRSRAGAGSPELLLAQALDESGYETGLPPRARANIAKLLAMIRERCAREPLTARELVEEISSRRDERSETEASSGEATNCVRLMSVHAAKGLEFPIVFLAALRTGPQNRPPLFCFSKLLELGTGWKHPYGGKPISDPVHLSQSSARRALEDAEENRLLYVAMTRAEEHLFFSTSTSGRSDWAKRVSEGLLLPVGLPRKEFHGTAGANSAMQVPVTFTAKDPPPDTGRAVPSEPPSEEFLDPPEVIEKQDTVVPVTSVAQFVFCPRQYYLGRYLEWPAGPKPDSAGGESEHPEWTASGLGVAVHDMLAGKPVANAPAEAIDMVRRFRESETARRADRATRSGREFDFLIELEDFILRGQIDLWFEEGEELVLLDFKTDQVEPGQEQWHALRYGPQLRLYALTLERLTGRLPDRAVLWYLRTDAAVDVEMTAESMAEARRQIRLLGEAQHRNHFPLREGAHCLRCRYFGGACPAQIAVSAG